MAHKLIELYVKYNNEEYVVCTQLIDMTCFVHKLRLKVHFCNSFFLNLYFFNFNKFKGNERLFFKNLTMLEAKSIKILFYVINQKTY